MSISLAACKKERKLAFAAYRKLKNNAVTSRKQFIEELARQQSARGNESVSNAIQRINRNEEMRESYRRIKNVTKPFYGATERVLILNDKKPGEEKVTTKKIEIEKALCIENKKKFTAAYSSPFSKAPLRYVKNWVLRVECSILDKETQSEMKQGDIRKFIRSRPAVGST